MDLGTTGNRVMAFARDGTILAKSYYEFPQIFPRPGWVEHNPLDILNTAVKALQDVIPAVGSENIISLGITNQRETTIIWDRNTGQPVYNAIVWQDRRTEETCRQLSAHKEIIKQKTGLFIDPYFSATKIKWLLENVPGVKDRAERGELLFGTTDTWLLWNLTGRAVHCTEPSNASRTMLLDIGSLKFDQGLLDIFGVPANILPAIMDSDSEFGRTSAAITGREIPIRGILGDQQASLLAQCGWQKGAVKATYGTGIFVMTNTLEQLCRSDALINTVAWKIKGRVNYALEGSIFMGGASIQWLRDNLRLLDKSADSEALAASLPDNEGVYLVPAFQGLGAPYWDATARAQITGLTRKSTRANIVRAALEAMAFQVQDVIREMQKTINERLKVLKADGGAAMNNFLLQYQSDISRLSLERGTFTETTALGVAMLSGLASGFWDLESFSGLVKPGRVFTPQMDSERAEAYYRQWQGAVQSCLRK